MMAPSTPTVPYLPRLDPTTFDRSPSRSPRRRPQFAFGELDPLLGNLSPDSTLRALRATDTIRNGAAQEDALASSIADATPAEREMGIRAAFAAQKLRGWKDEIAKWKWPSKQERGLGLGFVPPSDGRGKHRGCLPVSLAEEYEARIEEVRDDLGSLGIDEIKYHALQSHRPGLDGTNLSGSTGARSSYGRMRDFTALITATIMQALPDLAKLNRLLDTWDIRLRVLRELPRFLEVMQAAQCELQQAFKDIRDPISARSLTEPLLDSKKLALGGQVSDMGRRIDRLLDMLEGQDDSLPQAWIDRLDKIELDYASWVVEAQQLALRNQLSTNSRKTAEPQTVAQNLPHISPRPVGMLHKGQSEEKSAHTMVTVGAVARKPVSELPGISADEHTAKLKPSLKLDLAQPNSHKREPSKVSVAESMYSTLSDISNAEIVDAKSTSVLPSPKISMVDNPFRASRDELTWFGSTAAAQQQMAYKPPMLQRASTASIEVFSKEKLKEVVLKRSSSWDMLSEMAPSPDSTPSKAFKQLTGGDRSSPRASNAGSGVSHLALPAEIQVQSTPFLEDELSFTASQPRSSPSLPRRSSKRNTIGELPFIASVDTGPGVQEQSVESPVTESKQIPRRHKKSESLNGKIQDILTTLPTKIHLAKDKESVPSSSSEMRTSTPTPALTLSPAKADPTSHGGGLADEIKLYHLTGTGQGREAPPVKLYVRTVGDGDRVMVRVGGGWADLGEYLKEYSQHHGSRATADGRLEVASFPGNGQAATGTSVPQGRRKSKSPRVAQTTFEAADIANPNVRLPTQRPSSPERLQSEKDGVSPPVPPIPSSYTFNSPTMTSASRHQGGNVANVIQADKGDPETPSQTRYSIVNRGSGVTTTTTITPPVMTANYTPLGGAGPKTHARRAATVGGTPSNNDVWVQGMVGKARAVSGGSPTIIQGPNAMSTTVTTTTTVSSTPPSSGRRVSSYFGSSPNNTNGSPITLSSSPSAASGASDTKINWRVSNASGSRKSSRMSLGDIGGIRRVFLRKKSDTVAK